MPTRCPQAACGTEPLKYGWSDPRCAVKYIPDFEDFVSEKKGGQGERGWKIALEYLKILITC